MSNKLVIFTLILPGLLLFLLCTLFPIVLSLILSFTFYKAIGTPKFIGFDNYIELFVNDKIFWPSIGHGFICGICLILIQHPLGIAVSIWVDRIGGKLEKIFRVIIFLPCMISIIVTARMWVLFLDDNFGAFNKILRSIGLDAIAVPWLTQQQTALWVVIFISMWGGFGWCFMLYYAGVKGIPIDLYEAGEVDGATGLKKHIHITLPMLMPILKMNGTFAILSGLKTMEVVYLTTNGRPNNSTQFIANYLYQRAFTGSDYGLSSTMATVFIVICLLCTVVIDALVKSDVTK